MFSHFSVVVADRGEGSHRTFDCGLLPKLKSKVYLEGTRIDEKKTINVMTVRLPTRLWLSADCKPEYRNYRANPFELASTLHQCGNVAVLDVDSTSIRHDTSGDTADKAKIAKEDKARGEVGTVGVCRAPCLGC